MDDKAIEVLSQGYSMTALAAELDISKDTLYRWIKENENFSDAISRARPKAQAFHERLLMSKLTGKPTKDGIRQKDIDGSALIFALKTRFHETFGEKQEVKQTGEININIDKEDMSL